MNSFRQISVNLYNKALSVDEEGALKIVHLHAQIDLDQRSSWSGHKESVGRPAFAQNEDLKKLGSRNDPIL